MASSTKFVLLFSLLLGCDNAPPEQRSVVAHKWQPREVDCSNMMWNWTNVGHPFMMTWCNSCHHSDLEAVDRQGAPSSYNFDTYQGTLNYKDRIIARVIEQSPSPMPPAGTATDAEMQRLHEWLECGMPE